MPVHDAPDATRTHCAYVDFDGNTGRLMRCPRGPMLFACFCDLHNDPFSVRRRNVVVKAAPAGVLRKLGLSKRKMAVGGQRGAEIREEISEKHRERALRGKARNKAAPPQPSAVGSALGFADFPATRPAFPVIPGEGRPAYSAVEPESPRPLPTPVVVQLPPPPLPEDPWKRAPRAWAAGAWKR